MHIYDIDFLVIACAIKRIAAVPDPIHLDLRFNSPSGVTDTTVLVTPGGDLPCDPWLSQRELKIIVPVDPSRDWCLAVEGYFYSGSHRDEKNGYARSRSGQSPARAASAQGPPRFPRSARGYIPRLVGHLQITAS